MEAKRREVLGLGDRIAVRVSNDRTNPGNLRKDLKYSLEFIPADQVHELNWATHDSNPHINESVTLTHLKFREGTSTAKETAGCKP